MMLATANTKRSAENNILKRCLKRKILTKTEIHDIQKHLNFKTNANSLQRIFVNSAMQLLRILKERIIQPRNLL